LPPFLQISARFFEVRVLERRIEKVQVPYYEEPIPGIEYDPESFNPLVHLRLEEIKGDEESEDLAL
jgi:hypothetical protein